jgi:hypothetical protein
LVAKIKNWKTQKILTKILNIKKINHFPMPEEIKQKDYLLMKNKIQIKKMKFKLNNFKLK